MLTKLFVLYTFFSKTYSLCAVVEVLSSKCYLWLSSLPKTFYLHRSPPSFLLSRFRLSQRFHKSLTLFFSSIHSRFFHFFTPTLFPPHPPPTPLHPQFFPYPHPKHSPFRSFIIFGLSISKIVQKYKISKEKHAYSIFTNFRFPLIFLLFLQ